MRSGSVKYKAFAIVWDVLQALCCTYHSPNSLNCAAVAEHFRCPCAVGNASWYLPSLKCDVDAILQNIWPFGLAMVCWDISVSVNRNLKHGHNEHINRGQGGAHFRGIRQMRCQGLFPRPSTGRPVCKHNV